MFPWAPFRSTKAAVKLHTLLDLRGSIPTFIHISDGKMHDVNVLDLLLIEAGAFYIMDRGYLDFERLYALDQAGGFFVTRASKTSMHGACIRRRWIAIRGSSATRPSPLTASMPPSTTPATCAASAIAIPRPARTCASNASTALPRTLCGRKSGSPSASMSW